MSLLLTSFQKVVKGFNNKIDVFATLMMQWLVEYNAALASICFMTLLGFVDDVLDIPWRVWVSSHLCPFPKHLFHCILLELVLDCISYVLPCDLWRAGNYYCHHLLLFLCWWPMLGIQQLLYRSLLFHILD